MLRIDRLTPALGAEISGIDLGAELTQATANTLYELLTEHQVLFFRDQDVSPRAQVELARSFGELDEIPHPTYKHDKALPMLVLLHNDDENPPDTDDWHKDLTFRPSPPFLSILVADIIPELGGDTLWRSMIAAYHALSPSLQSEVEALAAIHDIGAFRNDFITDDFDTTALNQAIADVGSSIHPVVARHPVTGARYLNINPSFTNHIVGMKKSESDRLLSYLLGHMEQPEFQVRFRWQTGSVAIWDNRVTQHYALCDYLPNRRHMRRVTVLTDTRL